MAWIWILPLTIATLFLFIRRRRRLPPGPVGLPIIGHFHLLGKNPHQDLLGLARTHGPIMSMRFGSIPTIIISSPAAAELILKTHDLIFANRPHHEASRYLGYEQRNIVFGPYGAYWRDMRKLCTLELLSGVRIEQFRPMRRREVGNLVESLRKADFATAVDVSARIAATAADMTCLMTFGMKFVDGKLSDEKGLKDVMKETMEEAAAFNLGDYFPYLRGLDLQGSARRLKNLSRIFDRFLERTIDEHVIHRRDQDKVPDFVDTMMTIMESGRAAFDFDRRHVKAVLLDMLLAGMDTSAAAIEWTLSEVINNPQVMKKLKQELQDVVGLDRMVEESDLTQLKYLNCVIKESMRLHPVGPLLIHESMEDCEVNGYHIPKKTRAIINVYAIGRDPDSWSNPETFSPERFVGSNVDVRGHDYQLIPFGTGRRGCPGLQLGLTMVQFVVAQLVHCFDWELPDGVVPGDLDMDENFGLVMTRSNHLIAIPIYKLNK